METEGLEGGGGVIDGEWRVIREFVRLYEGERGTRRPFIASIQPSQLEVRGERADEFDSRADLQWMWGGQERRTSR